MPRTKILCPSAEGKKGALLLGRVKADNRVAFANMPMTVTEDFVEAARQTAPEGRAEYGYRFSSPCVTKGCKQWDGERCAVSGRMLDLLSEMETEDLPDCLIRANCRWFAQDGAAICRKCTFVTTRRRV